MATKAKNTDANTPSVEDTREQEQQVQEQYAEDRQPSAFYEVSVNPELRLTEVVSINGMLFYADQDRNRREGTAIVDDVQLEGIKNVRDSVTGLQYLKTKKLNTDDANDDN